MLQNLRDYISSKDLKITILKDKVNIINYDKLRDISDKEITITKNNKKIKIIGTNLKLNKLLDEEILILGNIKKVDLNNE